MYKIDPRRTDLALEFQRAPIGDHGPELRHLLILFRGAPLKGKHVLICVEPHRRWMLGELSGVRGQPVKVFPELTFTNRTDAEWAVFKLRWRQHTGQNVAID